MHPLGGDAGMLLNRLVRQGFECQADGHGPGIYECVFSRPLSFQRVARLGTRMGTDCRSTAASLPSLDIAYTPAAPAFHFPGRHLSVTRRGRGDRTFFACGNVFARFGPNHGDLQELIFSEARHQTR
jgi:hypothetical protein